MALERRIERLEQGEWERQMLRVLRKYPELTPERLDNFLQLDAELRSLSDSELEFFAVHGCWPQKAHDGGDE
jgi:hypothetical protein